MTERSTLPAYVVGVFADAGALLEVERFFDRLPRGAQMAFVVLGLTSGAEAPTTGRPLRAEDISARLRRPVHVVDRELSLETGHVYLVPDTLDVIISGGRLVVVGHGTEQPACCRIDRLFQSLARDRGIGAIAAVLSTGIDAARGLRAIEDAGGLVLRRERSRLEETDRSVSAGPAQPSETRAPAAGAPEIARRVIRRPPTDGVVMDRARPDAAPGVSAENPTEAACRMLDTEFGVDFTQYKPTTFARRIERRIQLAGARDLGDYVERLRRERAELEALHRDLLIGVTSFFRDPEAFAVLEQSVLNELVRRKERAGAELRVWVAGCATGEEAYSLAILLDELARPAGAGAVKIFATDVHQTSLDVAARGLYGEETVRALSRERLGRYFRRRGTSYEVSSELRKNIVFARHDLLRDVPLTRMDLVSCRNVLIYLRPSAQQRVLSRIRFALDRDGVAFLGPSESLGLEAPYFETIDHRWRIYEKKLAEAPVSAGGHVQVARRRRVVAPAALEPGARAVGGADPASVDEGARRRCATNDRVHALMEALETSNEELRATRQELAASKQELESLNEELQSLNEELYTVSAEHRSALARLAELDRHRP